MQKSQTGENLLVTSTDEDMEKVLETVSVKVNASLAKAEAIHRRRLADIREGWQAARAHPSHA